MLSCRLHRHPRPKRSRGFLFLLFVVSSSCGFGAANTNGEQLLAPEAAATAVPLSENENGSTQQQIIQQQETIERWEVKYETLEAATEQFRIRAKSCQQQWEEETIRCTQLERQSSQLHATHSREISTLQATLYTLQATHSTLQHEYQTQLWHQMAQISFYEEQLSLKDAEMAQLQQKLQSIRTENAVLWTVMSTDYMTRTAAGGPAVDTQQHNTTMDYFILETTRSHSSFSDGTIQFQNSVLELLEGWWTSVTILYSRWEATALDGSKQVYTWMSNVLVPNLQDAQSHLMTRFQLDSWRFFQIVKGTASRISDHCYVVFDADIMTYEQGLRQGVEIAQTLLVSLIRLLASTADWISDSFQEVCKLSYEKISPWVILQAHHMAVITRQTLENLYHLHEGVVLVFDFCVVVASNYFLTNYGGNRDQWVYKILLFVKKSNDTSLLVALLEVLVGLAIIQISLAAFLRGYGPNREQRVKTIQSRGHELSVSLSRRSNHHHTSISKSSLSCSKQQQSLVSLRSNPTQPFYSDSRRRSTDELSIGGWSTTGQQVVSEIQSCCSDEYY